MEEWVGVLLLPGISHGLLHLQAVRDIGLEPLAKLAGQVKGQEWAGGRGSQIQPVAAEQGSRVTESLTGPLK